MCEFSKLTSALRKFGFAQFYIDYSLFTYNVGDTFLCILINVDDLLITRNSVSAVTKFSFSLSSIFHVKDLGVLKYFLGIEVSCNSTGLYLCNANMHLRSFLKMV